MNGTLPAKPFFGGHGSGILKRDDHCGLFYDPSENPVKNIVRKSTGNHQATVYIDVGFEYLYEIDGSTIVLSLKTLLLIVITIIAGQDNATSLK